MTAYDGVMIGLVLLGMLWGACRGLTWQVASLASLVLGYAASHQASAQLAPHLPGEPIVARAASMLVIYVLVSGFIFFAAWLVRATLRKLRFEAYDRHLGMVLGGLEGGFIGVVGTLFVVSLAPASRAPVFESRAGQVVSSVLTAIGPALPSEAQPVLQPFFDGTSTPRDGAGPVPEDATAQFTKKATGSSSWWWLVSNAKSDASPKLADHQRDAFNGLANSLFGPDENHKVENRGNVSAGAAANYTRVQEHDSDGDSDSSRGDLSVRRESTPKPNRHIRRY